MRTVSNAATCLVAALAVVLLGSAVPGGLSQAAPLKFPSSVRTLSGRDLDVAQRAEASTVVVVTIKAHWCPVCLRQLERLKTRQASLRACGTEFIVLAPGPSVELESLRDRAGFEAAFVEDEGLRIAESLGLRMNETEIAPAIFVLESDLRVRWMQKGRSGAYYGDAELVEQIACARRERI